MTLITSLIFVLTLSICMFCSLWVYINLLNYGIFLFFETGNWFTIYMRLDSFPLQLHLIVTIFFTVTVNFTNLIVTVYFTVNCLLVLSYSFGTVGFFILGFFFLYIALFFKGSKLVRLYITGLNLFRSGVKIVIKGDDASKPEIRQRVKQIEELRNIRIECRLFSLHRFSPYGLISFHCRLQKLDYWIRISFKPASFYYPH